jgi:hypothetical protein
VLVWAAITARGYAAIALLSTLLLGLAHRAFLGDAPRARAAIAYGVTAAAALHTQYYLGFLLAGLGLALVAAGRWRAVGAYALCMLAVAALSTPLFLYTGAQMAAHTTAGAKPGLAGSVAEAARHAESLVLSMHAVSFGRAGRWVARLLFWGAAAWSVAGALRTRASLANVGVLAGVAATMVAGYGVARSLTSVEAMSMRHTVALLVPALALTLALLTARPGAARTLAVGALVAVVMSADALWLDYRDLDSNPPHKAIVAWVEARPDLRPEQPLLVFPAESALALPYHVTVPNRVVPLPVPPSLTVYDPRSDAITSEAALEAAVAPAIGPSGEAWLLWYSQRSFLGVDLGSAVLERWLDRAFDVVEQADLEDCRVLHLRRRAGPR